jgi:hypothetical protein
VADTFVRELLKRPMSTWTVEEMHTYSIATGQACPECCLTSGDKCERSAPPCADCGDETCTHGGCRDPHCKNFCHQCQREREAAREAAYQRDVAGPLLGLDKEGL